MYKRNWLVYTDYYGFKSVLVVYGTEEEMQEYMKSEYGYVPAYTGAIDEEVKAAKTLRLPIYLAPEIKRSY